MKILLSLFSVLILSIALWAQGDGDSPLCSDKHVCQHSDNTCNSYTNACPPDANQGCVSDDAPFTAQCTGNYDVDVWVTGCTGHPDCKVCVYVRKATGELVATCGLNVCSEGLTKTCVGIARLQAGSQYRIFVCLTFCDGVTNCNGCNGAGCVGHGCVRYAQTAPCWLP